MIEHKDLLFVAFLTFSNRLHSSGVLSFCFICMFADLLTLNISQLL